MSSIPATPAAPVKLVVWDLDDSLWQGTLSEGPVTLPPGRAALLHALVDHGVMLSISSRNDEDRACARLAELGLLDLFVLARINWQPKGAQVRSLVDAARLRAQNVLFVDDNHLNREEVRAFVPGIEVVDPGESGFDDRLAAIIAASPVDPDRRRLAGYRQLEARAAAAAVHATNIDFLRSCDIRVALRPATGADAERLHEILARTNQLNYTKQRIDRDAVDGLLADPDAAVTVVHVSDRFGDAGLVGAAVVRDGRAEHFAFSCRILGMGVERLVHRRLGAPALEIVEPVSVPLEGPHPDWLTLAGGDDPGAAGAALSARPVTPATGTDPDVLFVGGCDLESTIAFLPERGRIATRFNRPHPDNPRLTVHADSIDFLLLDDLDAVRRQFLLDSVPFIDPSVFEPPDWGAWRHVVYSPLIDYVQAKYVSDEVPGFYLSYGDVEWPAIDDARVELLVERGLDRAAVERFRATWRPVVKPDETWEAQLDTLFQRCARAEVTVLLGATTTFDRLDERRLPTHRRANALVRRVAARYANVHVVEVDPLLEGRADFRDGIRHYSRRVYAELADRIAPQLGLRASPARRTARRGLLRRALSCVARPAAGRGLGIRNGS